MLGSLASLCLVLGIVGVAHGSRSAWAAVAVGVLWLLYSRPRWLAWVLARLGSVRRRPRKPATPQTVPELHARARAGGGGAYLATGSGGEWIAAPAQAAVLVLAGPRAGKTSSVVIPALLAHPGAAVATSTKPEVLAATLTARRALGQTWFCDLQGHGVPAGCRALRWSPVQHASDWQRAMLVAEAMTGATDIEADASHWRERAGALIACCLHAAALGGLGMRELAGWVLRHDVDAPLAELEPGSLATDVLTGIKQTSDRERSGIFSTASRVLRAYRSPVALATATEPTFDPEAFAASHDTVYIAAAAHEQQLLAPVVVGLLTEIRHATYRRAWTHGPTVPPVLFMLDEAANVAPLPDLPSMLSEAGGQGLQVVVVLQDMSQARRRWPRDADGMLSLFGARVILAGVADLATLEQLSTIAGEYDRPIETRSHQQPQADVLGALLGRRSAPRASTTTSWTTRRERLLAPGEIAQLRRGQALVMIGPDWAQIATLPYDRHPTFAPLTRGG